MLKTTVSVLALSAALGLAPAAFAQDAQTTQTQQQPAAGQEQGTQQGGAKVIVVQPEGQQQGTTTEGTATTQPAEGATTTTQTEGTTTTTQPAQTETTTQPAEGQEMQVETVPAEETTTQPAEGEQMEVETQPAEAPPVPGQIFQQTANQFLSSTLTDATVQSTEGENIGEVNDLVVNSNGMIEGVVIGVGGFLGIGEKDVAVRLDQITIQQQEGDADDLTFVLNATREELENAPAFQTQQEQQAGEAADQAAQDAATGAQTQEDMQAEDAVGRAARNAAAGAGAAGGTTTTTTTTEQPAEGQSQ